MQNTKKSFLNGALILAAAGLICKVIGAVYKIPLRNFIGEEAMGIYSIVYPIYTFLLIFSTSGIPTAISKLVAQERSKGNFSGAHAVFISSLKMLSVIGGATTALMLLGAPIISSWLKIDSPQPVMAISFSLLFVSLLSAWRGYYQGLQNMTPTAITQLVEQIVKLAAGFYFAISWQNKFDNYVMSAAGALFGITVSELAAFLLIFVMYRFSKKKIVTFTEKSRTKTSYLKPLLLIAIPMTLGAAIKPLVDGIDSIMVKNILLNQLNFNSEYIDALYGYLKSDCGTLINMPTVLTVALSMSIVPAVSEALARNDIAQVKSISKTNLKLSFVFGLPCTLGFALLAKEILSLLYTYQDKQYGEFFLSSEAKLACAATFLTILSVGVLFLAIVQTTAGALQGIGKVTIPVINLGIGMAVKILLNLILVPIPQVNIYGVPIGTVLCYAIAAILDIIFVIKYTKIRFDFINTFLRPAAASAVMALSVLALKAIMPDYSRIFTVIIIAGAVIVYVAALIIFNVFDENDFSQMPAGSKIEKLFKKLGIKVRRGEQ